MAERFKKHYRVMAYNGSWSLRDRLASHGTGRDMRKFDMTKLGRRDLVAFVLSFMAKFKPEATRDHPAYIMIEEIESRAQYKVGVAVGKAGEWFWERRPEWIPA